MSVPDPRRVEVRYVEQPCKTALNPVKGMGFKWSLNPYMGCEHRCAFCYVRAYEKRADRPFDGEYGRAIRIKVNVAEVLRLELARPSWRREAVTVGAATDPYQPAEGRYRLTRACLQAFADFASPVSLITRGPMIVRDADLLSTLARRAHLTITFSIPTLDDEVWRRTEPGTAHPRQRLRAVGRLAAAGLRVGVGMAPILPGLSDRPDQIEAVVRAVRDAGASHLWSGMLHLRDGTRQHFLDTLERYWPELLPRYLADYRAGPYLNAQTAQPVQRTVSGLASRLGLGSELREFLTPPPAPPPPEQLSLLAS
ncbi:MAG TPA: radical SAM protein [Candidatus Dormibacteraeota bacterium]|nr:radical SAM protein [Candidatus Dormibacteraeota bacterium]